MQTHWTLFYLSSCHLFHNVTVTKQLQKVLHMTLPWNPKAHTGSEKSGFGCVVQASEGSVNLFAKWWPFNVCLMVPEQYPISNMLAHNQLQPCVSFESKLWSQQFQSLSSLCQTVLQGSEIRQEEAFPELLSRTLACWGISDPQSSFGLGWAARPVWLSAHRTPPAAHRITGSSHSVRQLCRLSGLAFIYQCSNKFSWEHPLQRGLLSCNEIIK